MSTRGGKSYRLASSVIGIVDGEIATIPAGSLLIVRGERQCAGIQNAPVLVDLQTAGGTRCVIFLKDLDRCGELIHGDLMGKGLELMSSTSA